MILNSIRGVLRLDPGVYVLNETLEIGSLKIVGWRGFVVCRAARAFKNYVYNLLVNHIFKKPRVA